MDDAVESDVGRNGESSHVTRGKRKKREGVLFLSIQLLFFGGVGFKCPIQVAGYFENFVKLKRCGEGICPTVKRKSGSAVIIGPGETQARRN